MRVTHTGLVLRNHTTPITGDQSVLDILDEMGASDRISGCISEDAIMTGLASLISSCMKKDDGEVPRKTRRLKILDALNDIVKKGDQEKKNMVHRPWDIISCTMLQGRGGILAEGHGAMTCM
jgi:hypothetical protein